MTSKGLNSERRALSTTNTLARFPHLEGARLTASSFRPRSQSALTHPATVTALIVLLLNDVVFKAMWPNSWATGKLSDLAWVVFAPPLLAFLLSFLVGRNIPGQRGAYLTAYMGLPLLYAAYNTFAPVHDVILWGLSIVSGGTAGSPLDATDSLVIPFGLGIALWVWRRDVPSVDSLRLRCGLLAAGVAALASVATSYPDPDLGIRGVGVSDDGAVHARHQGFSYSRSTDGGLTWRGGSGDARHIEWGEDSVETPRGRYVIQGPDIVLMGTDGISRVVYSTAYMQEKGNVWVQDHATARLNERVIATEPRKIAYDERSGNLIAAMGIQGVVVGTPDEVWTRYAVGPYLPVDFSFGNKTRLLLSDGWFWAMALALSLAMTGFALNSSQYQRRDLPMLAASAMGALTLLIGLPVVLYVTRADQVLNMILGASSLIVVALIGGAIALGRMPRESRLRKSVGLGLGVSSLLASGGLLLTFGGSDTLGYNEYGVRMGILAVLAYILGVAVLAVAGRELRHWRAVVPAFLAMNALVVLAFMLWLRLGIGIVLTQASAVALVGLAALALVGYIKRKQGTS